MSAKTNRQWQLASRPHGPVSRDNFSWTDAPVARPADGEFLIENLYLSFDPTLRAWMAGDTYVSAIAIGEVMRGNGVGRVIESNHPGFAAGDVVIGGIGWQDYCTTDGGGIMPIRKLPPGVPPTMALSVLGITGITAYFGMLDVGKVKEGDVVVVSGAAGATGSVAGQIAKLTGAAKVIGIAGGAEKCAWLTEEAHFDHAIDYKQDDVFKKLREVCPQGIDMFFDNVGGEILDAVLAQIAIGARVVLCGAISGYDTESGARGPRNYVNLIVKRGSMQGFIILDYAARFNEAVTKLAGWVQQDSIAYQEDIQEGLENAPETFQRIFTGKNRGKQLLKIAD